MSIVDVPTGADLATYMGRSDPGDFDDLVDQALAYVNAHVGTQTFTSTHREAVLSKAANTYSARGMRGGVEMTDFGPVYARRHTMAMDDLKSIAGTGGFA